ncbi:MAG: protein kinase [Planctomycetes bacterium]|nr:protein kinase [Planctomycetota bacterium]
MPKLTVEKGPEKGRSVNLNRPPLPNGSKGGPSASHPPLPSVLVGRDPSASLRIADTLASRQHFRVEARFDGFFIVDQDSMNGTFVNGERIKERRLSPGDKVQVGETLFSFLPDDGESKQSDLLIPLLRRGYRVEARVGRGGMGTVYRALQVSLNRVVALKILSPELVRDRSFISLFEQEARACAQLNHPHIVQVYDFGREGKEEPIYFFSMEYLPGGSVQEFLVKEKRLRPLRAVEIVCDAAKGLEYAEKKQIIHRDIKPDNLMIGEDAIIKIGDLGLAKSLKDRVQEEPGTIFGTPHYIAPEQFLGKPIDHRVDIYALGASLYRMLAGTTPYSGNNVKEILLKKVREEPPSLATHDPGLDPRLVRITDRMMKRAPEERYSGATELLADLEPLRRDLAGIPPPTASGAYSGTLSGTAPTLLAAEVRKTPRPGWLSLVGITLGCLAIAAGTYWLLSKLLPRKPGPGPGLVTGGDPDVYETLAQTLLAAAQKTERAINPADDASFAAALADYRKVTTDTPKSPCAAEAGKRLEALERAREEARLRSADRAREQEAETALDAAVKFKDQEFRKYGNSPGPETLQACLARFAKVSADHPDTKAAAKAAELVTALEGVKRQWAAAQAAVEKAEQDVPKLLEQADYAGAWTRLEELEREEAYRQFRPRLQALHGSVQQTCENAVRAVVDRADAGARAGNYDEALRTLDEFLKGKVHPGQIPPVRLKSDELKRTRDAAAEQAKAAKRAEELRGARDALALALAAAGLRDYDHALKGLRDCTAALTLPDVKSELEIRVQDLGYEKDFFEEFVKRSATKAEPRKGMGLADTSITIERVSGAIEGVNAAGFTLVFEGGRARRPFKWEEVSPTVLVPYLARAWKRSGRDELGLGILAFRSGLVDDARKAFGAAKADPSTVDAAQAYLVRATEANAFCESDASLLWDAGTDLYRERRIKEALAILGCLRRDYAKSNVAKNHADDFQNYFDEPGKRK